MQPLFSRLFSYYAATTMKQRLWYALLWYGVITIISHLPGSSSSTTAQWFHADGWIDWNMIFRFSAHCGVFGVLAILVYGVLEPRAVLVGRSWSIAVLWTGLGGLLDEIHQSFVPKRFFKWSDVALDTIAGALTILVLCILIHRSGQYTDSRTTASEEL